jgi:hypothetical protein
LTDRIFPQEALVPRTPLSLHCWDAIWANAEIIKNVTAINPISTVLDDTNSLRVYRRACGYVVKLSDWNFLISLSRNVVDRWVMAHLHHCAIANIADVAHALVEKPLRDSGARRIRTA